MYTEQDFKGHIERLWVQVSHIVYAVSKVMLIVICQMHVRERLSFKV